MFSSREAKHVLEYEEVQPNTSGERLYHAGVIDEKLAPGVSPFLMYIRNRERLGRSE